MSSETMLRDAFVDNIARYLLEESFPRVIKCIEMLDEDEIWFRPNKESNSVGNLVLHLCGNLNQWVLNGIGNQHLLRERQKEFDADRNRDKQELLQMLESTRSSIAYFIKSISAEELLRKRPVQVYEETGMTILIHVTEHFSYHTGQIAYITKWLKNRQTNFYDDANLNNAIK